MTTAGKTTITIEATVNASAEKVWKVWTNTEDITQWNNASPDWHTTRAENDLRPGGKFLSRMEAKDGSMGFDFWGIYDVAKPHEYIEMTLGDDRKVKIYFKGSGNQTHIEETFEAEGENPIEMQRAGWQAILDNFKQYTETN